MDSFFPILLLRVERRRIHGFNDRNVWRTSELASEKETRRSNLTWIHQNRTYWSTFGCRRQRSYQNLHKKTTPEKSSAWKLVICSSELLKQLCKRVNKNRITTTKLHCAIHHERRPNCNWWAWIGFQRYWEHLKYPPHRPSWLNIYLKYNRQQSPDFNEWYWRNNVKYISRLKSFFDKFRNMT